MKIKFYVNNHKFIGGMTMKDASEPEEGNMALHACLDTDAVLKNRRKLAGALGCMSDDFVCANQTHSANLHCVKPIDRGRGAWSSQNAISDTDALYTFEPGLVLCCFTADCVPVILCNERAGLIGVIHSGWGGTVKEITPRVLEHLIRVEHCNPSDFDVYIGAALSQRKFEVDQDVYTKFKDLGYAEEFIYYNEITGKYHIDNQLTVRKQCELAGIMGNRITIDRTCTYESPDCFSYRKDKKSGRHLSFIMKKNDNPGQEARQ